MRLPSGKRLVSLIRRMAQGCLQMAQALILKMHGGDRLNTAFSSGSTPPSFLPCCPGAPQPTLLYNPQTL